MPSIYHPRRPRPSPLWQLVHHGWDDFLADYEKHHRKSLGPLRRETISTVEAFLRCGDLASGFTRLQCPDCGHERLLAFTCKSRHFCPSCHQRRVRGTSEWIATALCHEVPHRQFVFTIPKVLRGIFRKRRQLLTHLFHTATSSLRDHFRLRLDLPDGKLGAIAAIHTFGDYLIFHPHLHVLAADGLFAPDGRFHCMPAENLAPAIALFRHRFLHALREAKLISPKKLAHLLSWKHSGFHIHAGAEQRVRPGDYEGRKRLAEYLLRHPFSLQKITWNATTKTVIYRSKRHYTTKRNFQIFSAPDFIAAILRFRKGSFEWQAIGKAHVSEEYPPTTSAKASGGEGLLMQELYCSFDRMFFAYILRSEQNPERLYYGFSSDLKKRLKVHNQGGNNSTKTGAPWTLAW